MMSELWITSLIIVIFTAGAFIINGDVLASTLGDVETGFNNPQSSVNKTLDERVGGLNESNPVSGFGG